LITDEQNHKIIDKTNHKISDLLNNRFASVCPNMMLKSPRLPIFLAFQVCSTHLYLIQSQRMKFTHKFCS